MSWHQVFRINPEKVSNLSPSLLLVRGARVRLLSSLGYRMQVLVRDLSGEEPRREELHQCLRTEVLQGASCTNTICVASPGANPPDEHCEECSVPDVFVVGVRGQEVCKENSLLRPSNGFMGS